MLFRSAIVSNVSIAIIFNNNFKKIMKRNLECRQHRFKPIKFVNSAVPSPCETQPYNKESCNCHLFTVQPYDCNHIHVF